MNKKTYENYVARLIKESEHRILNEHELLTLINYTENGFINTAQRAFGLSPNGMLLPNYSAAAASSGTKPMRNGETGKDYRAKVRDFFARQNQAIQTAYQKNPSVLHQIGTGVLNAYNKGSQAIQRAGDTAYDVLNTIARDGEDGINALGNFVATKGVPAASKFISTQAGKVKNSVPGQIVSGAFGEAGKGVKELGKTIGSYAKSIPGRLGSSVKSGIASGITLGANKLAQSPRGRSILRNLGSSTIEMAPDGGAKVSYPGGAVMYLSPEDASNLEKMRTYSESTIIKKGKRIKQKPVLTDLQEQLLLYYLKKVNNN